jgi:lysophospholipase
MDSPITVFHTIPNWVAVSFWKAPDGWPLRRFVAEPATAAEERGTILFQTGRGDFFEKYLHVIAHWRDRGWRVEGFDWRGNGGSGRLSDLAVVGRADDFDLLVSDLNAYCRAHAASFKAPFVLIGHSMGGHLVLRYMAEGGLSPARAVLVAPMLGLNGAPIPGHLARAIVTALCWGGLHMRPAWAETGATEFGGARQRRLTHDRALYDQELWWKEHQPDLHIGAPSWGWLRAAYRSIAKLNRPGVIEAILTDTLILAAKRDELIPYASILRVRQRLSHSTLVASEEAAHEMLRERDDFRGPLLDAIDRFIEAT